MFHGQVVQAGTVLLAPSREQRWAQALAHQVERLEQGEWRRLLGDDTERIDLGYTRTAAAGREARNSAEGGRLLGSPQGPAGVLGYFRALEPRRLVITGAAGAGKSVLALELMLALIDGRGPDDPVPVRLQLAGWDTRVPLTTYLTEELTRSYAWPRRMARALVRHGLVLPVLDGLDEMDPPRADGRPDRAAPRARAALRLLNAYQAGRHPGAVVLTVRTDAYEALGRGGGPSGQDGGQDCGHSGGPGDGRDSRLLDAARITVDPVGPQDALAYLRARATDRTRWQPLLDDLAARSGSPLAALLSTPWRLCLVATVYAEEGEPGELTRYRSARALDRHLLARLVPAAVALHPRRGNRPEAVHRRLHQLAGHLDGGARPRAAVVLHELWCHRGATRIVAVRSVLVVLAALAVAGADRLLPLTHRVGLLSGQALAVLPVVLALIRWGPPMETRPRTLRLGTAVRSMSWPATAVALAAALLTGAANWVAFGGLAALLAFLGVLVPGLLARSLTVVPGAVLRPRRLVGGDLVFGAVLGAAIGVALTGPLIGLCGVRDGILLALPRAAFAAFALVGGVGQRYLTFLLFGRGALPLRLGAFLDWATDAGLLRLTGPAYQFRHREFQDWLAATPEPLPATPPTEPARPQDRQNPQDPQAEPATPQSPPPVTPPGSSARATA
ncbi:NACHT domain-containing protein [Kitasatospora sp. NPDC049258]|uniref:NACHT domain-containing protein n=1 Tax=Kitasatospora sp. NPDC049258 TaxID=3155394 RepID=UPI0034461C8B